MAYSLSRQHRLYLQAETTFGTIPNTSGTASVGGSNACKFRKFGIVPNVELLVPPDKTGSRTVTRGTAGRKIGSWTGEWSLIPNGAAGTVPDVDPVLQAIFGQAAVVAAGTSVTYNLSDAVASFTAYGFRKPASVMQMAALGCVVERAQFQLGQDIAAFTASGACKWALDSVNFATTDTEGKGGLTAYPIEPASPVTNGVIVPGFTGQATLDGNVLANISTANVDITLNNSVERAFGSYYAAIPGGDVRDISLSFDLFDDDSVGSTNLYLKAVTKAAINVVLQIGTVAGSILTLNLKGVQLASPNMDDGQRRWIAKFGASRASGTGTANLDEIQAVFT